jgi:Holliday junction DNA helicase RuvA
MIGFIRGKLVFKSASLICIETNGLGYELEIPTSTFYDLPQEGSDVRLVTHLQVREDSHTLYGFLKDEERQLFRALTKISGVGARIALGVLSGINVKNFYSCVSQKDIATLTTLPGVGKKTAERLIIEMQDKVMLGITAIDASSSVQSNTLNEAFNALIALGYKVHEARHVLEKINADGKIVEELLKEALQIIHNKN